MHTTRINRLSFTVTVVLFALALLPVSAQAENAPSAEAVKLCTERMPSDTTLWMRCVRAHDGLTDEEMDSILRTASLLTGQEFESASAAQPSPTTLTLNVKVLDQYLAGNGAVFHENAVTQNSLTLGLANGCYLDLWLSQGFDDADFSSNFGDELDYSGGCVVPWQGMDFDMGVIYIDAHKLGRSPDGDVWGPYLKVSKHLSPRWSGSVKFEPYLPGGEAIEGGWLVHGRLGWSRSNPKGYGLTVSGGTTYDDGAFGFVPGFIGVLEISASVPLGKIVLVPSAKGTRPVSGAEDRGFERAFGLATAISF